MKIKPVGSKILVLPLETKNHVTESGIEIFQNQLSIGEVIEVSDEYEDVYKVGGKVLYSSDAGRPQPYNGKDVLWMDARSPDKGGDIHAKIIEE